MNYAKVGPALLEALENYQSAEHEAVDRTARVLGLITTSEESPKPARVVVFLHCDKDADLVHLERELGVELNQHTGGVRTAIVPLESLDALSQDPRISRVVGARQLSTAMDVAPAAVHLPAFRQATGLTGRGVIIGIVDTGIDPNHPDFAGRILRIWDQTASGSGVGEGRYGAEVTGSSLTMSRDTHSHGTHVAGIAAAADPTFGGIAPEAELVIVKSDLKDAHIADGVRYIFRVAGELGRPCVVNLSVGGHWDAHDGSDSLSQIINSAVGPGRIVCAAAGNEGDKDIHARVDVKPNEVTTILCSVPVPPGARRPRITVVNGWYAGADEIEVALSSPGGFQTPFQTVITDGSPIRRHILPDAQVTIATPGPDPANGDHQILVMIQPPPGAITVTSGTWRLQLRGRQVSSGRVDAWILDDVSGAVARFSGQGVSNEVKVGSPGVASGVHTVGCYSTKIDWVDIDGKQHRFGHALHELSDFSSPGPRRDGAEKPDCVAPGAVIVSCLAEDSLVNRPYIVDRLHRVDGGTSMASPFVAGIVALLLQREPNLDPEKVRATLRGASAIPGQGPGTFDKRWGYGLLDAARL